MLNRMVGAVLLETPKPNEFHLKWRDKHFCEKPNFCQVH